MPLQTIAQRVSAGQIPLPVKRGEIERAVEQSKSAEMSALATEWPESAAPVPSAQMPPIQLVELDAICEFLQRAKNRYAHC